MKQQSIMDAGFVLLDTEMDKHVLPLPKLKIGERVNVGDECCVMWTNPPQIDMSVEWCVKRDLAIDGRNRVLLTTPQKTTYFVFGRRVDSITHVFIINPDTVAFFVTTGTCSGIIVENRFFEVDHFVFSGSKNNITFKNNILDFGQNTCLDIDRWETTSSYFKPAIRQSESTFSIHSTQIEARSKNNIYWKLDEGRLRISYLREGNVTTIYEDGVNGDPSCGSL